MNATYLAVAAEAARRAGKLQRERLWTDHDIRYKGEIDLVTEVDEACEELIVATIRAAFPDHDILAEEQTRETGTSRYRWIVDPLDGTTNYAHGFPWFCVSIALEIDGEMAVGVVYQPVMDELFSAVKGEGAFVNGRPIHVSSRAPLNQCLLATGFPYDRTRGNENNIDNFYCFQFAARAVRRAGAAALDLACVAAGRLDGYWELKLKPWDVAAGCLLVTEAGGRVTTHNGDPFSVSEHRILASNGLIHDEMLAVLAAGGTR
ncbi:MULTISPECIES: inositol monophosphatase family protein [Geobacter]|uniref:Inositol-1-monophosphatase n=2 Tax=Geobacter TaxID=28231 RepID=A0A0C1QQJ6_9BACT|nr:MULTISPECIES: inositol monophosphatase family protein [Geobacter]ANA40869.1 inositol monophosphatase [Geobacter anodireducens]KIE42962.1 histidinol phosphate phosphatase [Geobacter soli]MBE2887009.1 inositol monophosphatase [Geobacter anodireducens]HMN02812.1 inositol monophosphatase family protein [Geobacter anodireducens]